MTASTLTNAGKNLMRDAIKSGSSLQITYVEVGTGSTAPAATDTQLVASVFRKAVTSVASGGATGEALITMYISPTDTVGTVIAEVGWFAGGSSAIGSGTLIARGLYSHTHSGGESIVLTYDHTFA